MKSEIKIHRQEKNLITHWSDDCVICTPGSNKIVCCVGVWVQKNGAFLYFEVVPTFP